MLINAVVEFSWLNSRRPEIRSRARVEMLQKHGQMKESWIKEADWMISDATWRRLMTQAWFSSLELLILLLRVHSVKWYIQILSVEQPEAASETDNTQTERCKNSQQTWHKSKNDESWEGGGIKNAGNGENISKLHLRKRSVCTC